MFFQSTLESYDFSHEFFKEYLSNYNSIKYSFDEIYEGYNPKATYVYSIEGIN